MFIVLLLQDLVDGCAGGEGKRIVEDMCYGIRRAEANLLLKGCSKSENLSLSLSLPRGPSDHGCVLKDRGTREERETEIGTLGTALQEQICCDYDDFRQSSRNKKKISARKSCRTEPEMEPEQMEEVGEKTSLGCLWGRYPLSSIRS